LAFVLLHDGTLQALICVKPELRVATELGKVGFASKSSAADEPLKRRLIWVKVRLVKKRFHVAEASASCGPHITEGGMAYKDILVYAGGSTAAATRLEVAASIARAHEAHLTALHVRALPYVPADLTGSVPTMVIEWQEDWSQEQATQAKKVVDEAIRRTGQNIEWRLVRGDTGAVSLLHSRYVDLVVISQSAMEAKDVTQADDLPELVVMGAGRPALIVPQYGKFPVVGDRMMIAWNRTRESARAVHDALPLLVRAKAVMIMEVNPKTGDTPHIAGADIATHLARHGVKAEVSSTVADDIEVGDAILSRIADLGADLLVMGAYGHSRLREYAFGGATLHVLRHMTVPVLMSH
jgi:nucleotide-binding universal stress UspA family protein